MGDGSEHRALGANLASCAEELTALTGRVQREATDRPRIETTLWSGPASLACEWSLRILDRELEAAIDLLRCAADLTGSASWEATQ